MPFASIHRELRDGVRATRVLTVALATGLVSLALAPASTSAATNMAADDARRVALVIANEDYAGADRLQTPVADAKLIGSELASLGYSVDLEINRTRPQMTADLARFSKAAAGARVALIYYAGHGFEVAGQNYLIPAGVSGVRALDQDAARSLGVPLRYVLMRASEGNPQTLVALVDACRTTPARGSDASRGFAAERAATGQFVAFSATAGGEALDSMRSLGRPVDHSPFAYFLAQRLPDAQASVVDVMQQVQADVAKATGGAQRPWFTSGLVGWLSLATPPQKAIAGATPQWSGPMRSVSWPTSSVGAGSGGTGSTSRPTALAGFGQRLLSMESDPPTPRRWMDEEILVDHAAITLDAASAAALRLWSDSGDTRATTALGLAHERGAPNAGIERDAAKAAALYGQAAKSGDGLAALWLGQLLARGDGVPKDLVRARALLRQAADASVMGAGSSLDALDRAGALPPRYQDVSRDANLGIAATLRPDQLGD
ncbi:peptidase C14, caspase catalytic subunit p20 [Burkholderia vietnamiensis G4]|uniref:Peptidase C14, caspase catalytic subunit p20 n=1 Tax=Burkholderia vietnamiensis (strain G4 / LMG 22486) TaxID=269482 RepID=A4JFI0_BURVG|nr:peptidase C14, caspase catalytic subunit p20 [Burkholderia vietnamiensis G4]